MTVVFDSGSLQEDIFHRPVREGDRRTKVCLLETSTGKVESEELLLPAILTGGLTKRGHSGVLMQHLPACRTSDHPPKN